MSEKRKRGKKIRRSRKNKSKGTKIKSSMMRMAGIKRIREKEVTQGSKGEDCMMESSRDQDTVCLYPLSNNAKLSNWVDKSNGKFISQSRNSITIRAS